MSFSIRILALLVFIVAMLLWDLRNPPEKRARWKIYFFLLLTGTIGAMFGISVDSITSQISSDYFIYGKGLAPGPGLPGRVLLLGAQAGFSGAVFGGCCYLVAYRFKSSVEDLYPFIPIPLLMGMLWGAMVGVAQYFTNAVSLQDIILLLGADRAKLFVVVWMTHIGVYLGAVLGLIWGCLCIYRKYSRARIQR